MNSSDPGRPLVLDASIGIALVREEAFSARASGLVHDAARAGRRLLVPSHFWLEVVNVLGRRYGSPANAILEAIVELESAGIETVELDRPLLLVALDAVTRLHLTAYDAAYLALAMTVDGVLLTMDAHLSAAAGDRAQRIEGAHGPGIREAPETYEAPGWATWAGAGRYLAELRSRVVTGS